MVFCFGDWQLDDERYELRQNGVAVHIEPLVFDLLHVLVRNSGRVVGREEIIDLVWEGRIVSDATVSSCLKSARQALGDDGKAQRLIRTAHGRGFQFIATVTKLPGTVAVVKPSVAAAEPRPPREAGGELFANRPSIAVLRFRLGGMSDAHLGIADALPHDVISALSRLRWLFVIARGSTFRFKSGEADVKEVGRALGARYCLSGALDIFGGTITTTVELSDTRDGGVVWGDRVSCVIADIHEVRARVVANVVSALDVYIPQNEARFARLAVPESLDTWSAYHLGLQHMYRFSRKDNEIASSLFERCVAAEPDFVRAHAGLSFTHFQNAFLKYGGDPHAEIALARRHAEQSIQIDPLDPFANFTMGRSYWLEGDLDGSLAWLDRATLISPNYAQGIYARGWTDALSGRSAEGRRNVDLAMSLSPLDPFVYGFLGTRALSYIVEGDYSEAMVWADKAARAPGAHFLMGVMAVIACALAGETGKANAWAADTKRRRPDATAAHFLQSFPFKDEQLRRKISAELSSYGL